MLQALVVFTPEQIETGCESVSSVLIEMVGRDLVLRVVDEVNTLNDVLLDETIDLSYALSVLRVTIVHINSSFGLSDIGNTEVFFTLCIVLVSFGKDV